MEPAELDPVEAITDDDDNDDEGDSPQDEDKEDINREE
jgi:hypothetical protein